MLGLARLCGSGGRDAATNERVKTSKTLVYDTCGKTVLLQALQKRDQPQDLLLLNVDVLCVVMEEPSVLLQMAQGQGIRSIVRAMTNSRYWHISFLAE